MKLFLKNSSLVIKDKPCHVFFFSLLGFSIISYLREISVRIIVSNQVVAHNGKGIFFKKQFVRFHQNLNKKMSQTI